MKTAVEWLVEKLSYRQSDGTIISHHSIITKLVEQAKEMEKEQKIEFAKHFLYKCKDLSILMAYNQVEQELIKYELNQNKTRL
jgi:hypothetical protein